MYLMANDARQATRARRPGFTATSDRLSVRHRAWRTASGGCGQASGRSLTNPDDDGRNGILGTRVGEPGMAREGNAREGPGPIP